MARVAKTLTALEVNRLSIPGLHAVGGVPGLCLRVLPPPSASRNWTLRILVAVARREIGVGGYPRVSFARAREAAQTRTKRSCRFSPRSNPQDATPSRNGSRKQDCG